MQNLINFQTVFWKIFYRHFSLRYMKKPIYGKSCWIFYNFPCMIFRNHSRCPWTCTGSRMGSFVVKWFSACSYTVSCLKSLWWTCSFSCERSSPISVKGTGAETIQDHIHGFSIGQVLKIFCTNFQSSSWRQYCHRYK